MVAISQLKNLYFFLIGSIKPFISLVPADGYFFVYTSFDDILFFFFKHLTNILCCASGNHITILSFCHNHRRKEDREK